MPLRLPASLATVAAALVVAAPAAADYQQAAPGGSSPDQRIAIPGGAGPSGLSLAGAVGDVNGDGVEDFAASLGWGQVGYVTFSRRDGGTIDATHSGFRIEAQDCSWYSVAG